MTAGFRFDSSHIEWSHIQGGPDDGYPIDYSVAVLGFQEDNGTLDLMVRFAPKSHCHFHRHVAATTTLVLEGEHHVIDIGPDGRETHKLKPAGTYSHSPGGDVHMERGGPDGALVFFALHEPSGRLFDLLDLDRNIISHTTIAEFAEQQRQAS